MADKINPTVSVFGASPDHAIGVTSYAVEVYRVSDNVLIRTNDVGKPAPNAANDITVPLLKGTLQNNVPHVFYPVAIGPAGSARSVTPSNPFVFADPPGAPTNPRAQ